MVCSLCLVRYTLSLIVQHGAVDYIFYKLPKRVSNLEDATTGAFFGKQPCFSDACSVIEVRQR